MSMAKGLRELGWEVEIWTGPPVGREGDLLFDAWEEDIPIRIIPEMRREILPSRDLRAYLDIRNRIRDFKPDVIHTHSSKAGVLGRFAAKCENVSVVVHTVHGLPFGYGKWLPDLVFPFLEKLASKRCDRAYCVCENLIPRLTSRNVIEPERVSYLPWGFSFSGFDKCMGSWARTKLGISPGSKVIIVPARLAPDKGHSDALKAMAEILKLATDEVKMVFVGDGELRKSLELEAASMRLSDSIFFAGRVSIDEIKDYFAAGDVTLLPSYREGLPVVLAESFMAGRPCISYDTDGVKELVIPEKTGVLVTKGHVAGLVSGIMNLLSDAEKRDTFALNGRNLVLQNFSEKVQATRLDTEYRKIAANKGFEISRTKNSREKMVETESLTTESTM